MRVNTRVRFLRPLWAALGAAVLALGAPAAVAGTQCAPAAAGMERCVSGLAPALLMQMQQTQQASNWCWAASISMVLRRYGSDVSQEQVVRAHFGESANTGITAEAILQLLNRSWHDQAGRAVVSSAGPLPTWRRHLGLTAPEVIGDLDSGKPLLVGTQQHAMVLVQLVYERSVDGRHGPAGVRLLRAVVLDPASEAGVRTLRTSETTPEFLARVGVEAPQTVRRMEGIAAIAANPAL